MNNNPEAIKLLASKLASAPEWTGANGIFVSRFSGFKGVKIFADYVKHLKKISGNRIPGTLGKHHVYDYIHYLKDKPEEFKKEYKSFYDHLVYDSYGGTKGKMKAMISNGKLTEKSIIEFANIFNNLGIGYNVNTIIPDYQSAVSQAIVFNSQKGQTTDNSAKQNYQHLVLSDKEKSTVAEKCRQKGVLISEEDLDSMYYGSDDGCLYYGDGNPVTQAAIGVAVAETLQYQVSKGDAEKLELSAVEIDAIIAVCNRKGLQMKKEDLENMYVDKDGNIYDNEGTVIKNTIIVTAITQTATYAEKYAKMADRRGKMKVLKDEEKVPESVTEGQMPEPLTIPKDKPNLNEILGPALENQSGMGMSGIPTSDRTPSRISMRGGSQLNRIIHGRDQVKPLDSKLGAILDGVENFKKQNKPSKILWTRNPGKKTRKKGRKSQNPEQDQMAQDQIDQDEQTRNRGSQRSKNAGGLSGGTLPTEKKKGSLPRKVGLAATGAGAFGLYKAVYASTFLFPLQAIDNHYFISSILKILFP